MVKNSSKHPMKFVLGDALAQALSNKFKQLSPEDLLEEREPEIAGFRDFYVHGDLLRVDERLHKFYYKELYYT